MIEKNLLNTSWTGSEIQVQTFFLTNLIAKVREEWQSLNRLPGVHVLKTEKYEFEIYNVKNKMKVSLNPQREEMTISVGNPEGSMSELFESFKNDLTMSYYEYDRFQHSLILKQLTNEVGDTPLTYINPEKKTVDENLTPDIVTKIEDNLYLVLELKTTKNPKLDYTDADSIKYYRAIKNRLFRDDSCFYVTVFVTPFCYYSPCPFRVDSEYFLFEAMCFFRDLDIEVKLMGRDLELIQEDQEIYENTRKALKKISIPSEVDDHLKIGIDKYKIYSSLRRKQLKDHSRKIIDEEASQTASNLKKLLEDDALDQSMNCVRVFEKNYTTKNTRVDSKPVCQHPMVVLKSNNAKRRKFITCPNRSTPESELWYNFFVDQGGYFETSDIEESELIQIEQKLENEENFSFTDRSERFKKQLKKISTKSLIDLASRGVDGKRFRQSEKKLIVHDNQQRAFDLRTNVSDIEDFVNNYKSELSSCPLPRNILILLEHLREGVDDQTVVSDYELFLKTDLGRATFFLDCVMSEVNYSRKTNCGRDEFIFKQIPNYPALLCIKTTGFTKHVFYSLCFLSEDLTKQFSSPFRQPIDCGGYYVTKFISLDQNRLSHFLYCSSKVYSLKSHYFHLFSRGDESEQRKHFNFSLLVFLEDKQQTSEHLQLVRYSYMKILIQQNALKRPFGILNKFSDRFRSRLLLFFYNNFKDSFLQMVENSQYWGNLSNCEAEESADNPSNLISWLTKTQINMKQAVDLSYCGTLHNPEEGDFNQGVLMIFRKIIKSELKLRDCNNDYLGLKSKSGRDYKEHEFDPFYVAHMGDTIREEVFNKYKIVSNYEFEKLIFKHLSTLNILDYATTKASAQEANLSELYSPPSSRDDKNQEEKKRIKCSEAIFKLLDNKELSPILVENVQTLLESVEQRGIVVNLFKKSQIGGVREIFVLEICARLLISIVEHISRSICQCLDNEMLTKGDRKLKVSDDHFRKVARFKKIGDEELTSSSSSDASTWCQGFCCNVFSIFLIRLLPPIFHPLIIRVMNMFIDKKLELPLNLLDLFSKHKMEESTDEGMIELKKQFFGQSDENDLMNPQSLFLFNRSNFMQGILHYTSSLIHAGHQLVIQKHCIRIIQHSVGDEQDARVYSYITSRCSSDDSSYLITTLVSSVQDRKSQVLAKVRSSMLLVSYLIHDTYKLFSARTNYEKSTIGVEGRLEEFNSVWTIRNTIITPLIKFILPCMKLPVAYRLEDRQRQLANARSQILEHGGCIKLASDIQISQAVAYYNSMGLLAFSGAKIVLDYLSMSKHPFLGYFCMEPSKAAGLIGFDISFYKVLKECEMARRIQKRVQETSLLSDTEEEIISSKFYLDFGQSSNYRRFLNRIRANRETIDSYYSSNPIELYHNPSEKLGLQRLLQRRSINPSYADAFAYNTDSKMHASGVYLSSNLCLTIKEYKLNSNSIKESSVSKHTLIGLIKKMSLGNDGLKQEELFDLFPYSFLYDHIIELSRRFHELYSGFKTFEHRKRLVTIHFEKTTNLSNVSWLDCAKRKWFGVNTKGSQLEHDMTWSEMISKMTWLDEDYGKSLDASPFDSDIGLCNYLTGISNKRHTKTYLSSSKKSVSQIGFYEEMIGKDQKNDQLFLRKTLKVSEAGMTKEDFMAQRTEVDQSQLKFISLNNALALMLESPFTREEKIGALKLLSQDFDSTTYRDIMKLPISLGKQLLVLKIYKLSKEIRGSTLSSEMSDSLRCLRRYCGENVFRYVKPQKLVDGVYKGDLIVEGTFEHVPYRITGRDDLVESIEVGNMMRFCDVKSRFPRVLMLQNLVGCSETKKKRIMSKISYDSKEGKIVETTNKRSLKSYEVPITVSSNLPEINFTPEYLKGLDLKISNGSIRLIYDPLLTKDGLTYSKKEYTILSATPIYNSESRDKANAHNYGRKIQDCFKVVSPAMSVKFENLLSSFLKDELIDIDDHSEIWTQVLNDRNNYYNGLVIKWFRTMLDHQVSLSGLTQTTNPITAVLEERVQERQDRETETPKSGDFDELQELLQKDILELAEFILAGNPNDQEFEDGLFQDSSDLLVDELAELFCADRGLLTRSSLNNITNFFSPIIEVMSDNRSIKECLNTGQIKCGLVPVSFLFYFEMFYEKNASRKVFTKTMN